MMKYSFHFFILIFFAACLSCATPKNTITDTLAAADLKPFGRYAYNDKRELELISSAVNFGFSFEGKECKIYVSVPYSHNYLQYELDGVYQKRIKVSGDGAVEIPALSAGKHSLWIYKATEAHTGPIFIQKISAGRLTSLQRKSVPIIEFIGNSITCGAAADPSEVPCGTGQYHDQHNAYMAYGPRVARYLNANYIVSSVSGIGIYRNWNSNGPTMPEVYQKVNFQANDSRLWNFNTYAPKIVSIALGTNDFSNGDGKTPRLPFDTTSFINSYVKFISFIKSKYPATQIALLSSAMVNGKNREVLQNCLASIKTKTDKVYPSGKPVALFFFEPMQARGCGGHPNVEDHAILAKQLEPFFKKLLSE